MRRFWGARLSFIRLCPEIQRRPLSRRSFEEFYVNKRIAYFDCFSGASGDMIIGALIDAGLGLGALRRELAKLKLRGYSLSAKKVTRGGFGGTKFDVKIPHREHRHRRLADILRMIDGGRLSPAVRRGAKAVFRRLAEAEARAHGTTPGRIHFHEVGAVDSIVDIVGAVAGLELLGVGEVRVSAMATGRGYVDCAHGRLPVPAPATAYLLEGFPAHSGEAERELTTPTGAAVLTTLGASFGASPPMEIERVGYGAGAAEGAGAPNLLRVFLGRPIGPAAGPYETDTVTKFEANIDDATPEICAAAVERLLGAGALDAWLTPAVMKKGRAAWTLSALCEQKDAGEIAAVIFRETTTLGVRVENVGRLKLARKIVRVKTRYGVVGVKVGMNGGRIVTSSPEYEDCRRAAERSGAALREVYEAARIGFLKKTED